MLGHVALKLGTEDMDGVISLPVSVGRVVETLCSNHCHGLYTIFLKNQGISDVGTKLFHTILRNICFI